MSLPTEIVDLILFDSIEDKNYELLRRATALNRRYRIMAFDRWTPKLAAETLNADIGDSDSALVITIPKDTENPDVSYSIFTRGHIMRHESDKKSEIVFCCLVKVITATNEGLTITEPKMGSMGSVGPDTVSFRDRIEKLLPSSADIVQIVNDIYFLHDNVESVCKRFNIHDDHIHNACLLCAHMMLWRLLTPYVYTQYVLHCLRFNDWVEDFDKITVILESLSVPGDRAQSDQFYSEMLNIVNMIYY